MTRVLALLAAAAMVLGAIVVRDLLDDDVDGDSRGPGTVELWCSPVLAPVCNELAGAGDIEVRIQDDATVAAGIQDGTVDLGDDGGWLVAGPWPEVAAVESDSFPTLEPTEVLARSPVVLVGYSDRLAAAEDTCAALDWACIGGAAGLQWTELGGETAWGAVKVALPTVSNGAGLAAMAQAVASRLEQTDYATNDLDEDPADEAWFDRLAAQSADNQPAVSPLEQFLRVQSSLGVVAALEAEAAPAVASSRDRDRVRIVAPLPVVTADVRLWAADEAALGDVLDTLGVDRLEESLRDAGWRTPGAGVPEGGVDAELPDDAQLPNAGVLSALARRWDTGG